MSKKDSLLIPRRGFLRSSAIGIAVSGIPNSNADNYSEEINMDAKNKELLISLVDCLGGPWPEPCSLEPTINKKINKEGYRLEFLSYQVEENDRVPAILIVPDGVDEKNPVPGVVVWHQHNGEYHIGKSEPAGLAGSPMHHTGVALAKEGYVVLCPDALCFEERQDPDGKLKNGQYERFEFLKYIVQGKSMAWKNILDMRRAIDFLVTRAEIDKERIGSYGHSMGSTHTWLLGPHEPRLKALVGNCCMPTYNAIHDTKILHCFPNYIPGWMNYGDTPDIASLIAPKPLHLNFGDQDQGSPIRYVNRGIKRISKIYEEMNAGENFSAFVQKGIGHVLSDEMWDKTKAFFDKHLKFI